jgi:predicted ATP-grasp superfamily ATP-dependent carboligase
MTFIPVLATMQVADLSTDELKTLIRETVTQVLAEILEDPDEGLVIRPEVEQQLLQSRQRRLSGVSGVSIEEVAKQLGVTL